MKRWKIALVAFHIPDFTETFMERMIIVLQKLGHKVILFIPYRENIKGFDLCEIRVGLPTKYEGIKMVIKAGSALLKLIFMHPGRLIRFWREEKKLSRPFKMRLRNTYLNAHFLNAGIDHVHFFYLFNGIGKESLKQALKIKLSASVRGDDVLVYPRLNPGCYDLLAPKLSALHCISEHMQSTLEEFGFTNTKVFISGGSIGGRNQIIQRGKPNQKKTVLTVARLTRQKGLETAIEAISQLAKTEEHKDIRYYIIGDGELKDELTGQIQLLGMQQHIFLLGKKTHQEVFQNMQQAGLYLQPSRWEGLCNSTLEAMATGLPVLVSNIPPFTEYVTESQNGYFFERENPENLAEKAAAIFTLSEEELKKVMKNARATIEQKFSLELHMTRMEEMFSFLQQD